MKVLFIAGASNPLFDRLLIELEKIKFEVKLYESHSINGKARFIIWLKLFVLSVKDTANILRYDADLISVQFLSVRNYLISLMLAVFRVDYTISFWGSDYVSLSRKKYPFMRFVLRNAQFLSFNSLDYMSECEQEFGNIIKTCELRFGLGLLEEIDSIILSHSKRVVANARRKVMVGTNASPNQQHLELIEVLDSRSEMLKDFDFVFHMSYGDTRNRELVKARLRDAKFKYEIDENFYTGFDLALLRVKTDILVQLQKNDALSGAMQETMYAGGMVVTGSWLPYDVLREKGASWIEVDTLNELPDALFKAASVRPDIEKNREIISTVSSWKNVVVEWACAFRSVSRVQQRIE